MSRTRKLKEAFEFVMGPVKENVKSQHIQKTAYYINCLRLHPVKEKAILFEASHGVHFNGNAYALFKKIIEVYPDYKCGIVIENLEDPMIRWIKETYGHKNLKIIQFESKSYFKALATYKYLVNDGSFKPYFCKRDEQVYLNTGQEIFELVQAQNNNLSNKSTYANIQKNLFSTDKLPITNQKYADKVVDFYQLNGILNAEVHVLGHARVDLTLNSNPKAIRDKYAVNTHKKIILYAPVWHIEQVSKDTLDEAVQQVIQLQTNLGDAYVVYLKLQSGIDRSLIDTVKRRYLVPEWVDINEWLSIVDMLVTNDTDLFLDYLPLERPIYFYRESTMKHIKFDTSGLPGKISFTFSDLIESMSVNHKLYLQKYQEQREIYLTQYCQNDYGITAPLTIDFMLNKRRGIQLYKSNKKRILFYGGGFYNNGITNSIVNLSKYFDYDKYEFILIENNLKSEENKRNMERLSENVHVITRFPEPNRNVFDTLNENLLYRQGYQSKYIFKDYIHTYFELEYKRSLGNIEADILVDFSGYNKKITAMFAFAPIKKKMIFLHNDMLAEYNKQIDGKYKHRWNLKVIFSLYRHFDKLISVTDSVNEANKKGLKQFISDYEHKMMVVSNIINGDEIQKLVQKYRIKISQNEKENVVVDNHFVLDSAYVNFVNVGRLSPEKNHVALLQAFRGVVDKKTKCRLYILGEGPLKRYLETLIQKLKLENHVFLLGYIENPFIYIAECDCFVLTSNYEGQGMAILEAQILGKPVIGTNVNGINSMISPKNGLLVENNIVDIREGLLAFLDGKVPQIPFDYVRYNEEIMKKLESEFQ